jgi:ABC-type Mn2+/Zn2+ transport system permease subunit
MFEPMFMRLALVASMAIGATLGVLGVYLVMRRVLFFGLVLANVVTLGAAIAAALGWPPEWLSLIAGACAAIALGEAGSSTRMSDEAMMGWAYAAAASATVLVLSRAAGGSVDTLHLLFGNVLAVQVSHVIFLVVVVAAVGLLQLLLAPRLLLVTFDSEAARVAGVNTRAWSLGLNLAIGIAAAAAVHEIGALSTFALLSLPAMMALLVTRSIRSAFAVAFALGAGVPALALAASFYLDLPAGPACVALLALGVVVAALGTKVVSTRRSAHEDGTGTQRSIPRRVYDRAADDHRDGNEAAASVAHRISEVIAIYPIS